VLRADGQTIETVGYTAPTTRREYRADWTRTTYVQGVKSNHLVEVVGGGVQPAQTRQCRDEGAHTSFRLDIHALRALLVCLTKCSGLHLIL